MEKLPFIVCFLVVSSVLTVWAQHQAAFVVSGDLLPWYVRGFNCLVFYTMYLGKLLWPENLSIFYPYPHLQLAEAFVPPCCRLWCPSGVFFRVRSQPYLLMGWLWFVGMLVPVIGIVQVGMQAIADR